MRHHQRLQLPQPNGHLGTAAPAGTHVLGELLQRRLDGFAGKSSLAWATIRSSPLSNTTGALRAPSMLTVGV